MLQMQKRIGGYELDKVLGEGGMGEVWLAHDTFADRPVALKFIKPHLLANPGFRTRFSNEATVYMVVERHAAWANEAFTPVVLGISRGKIDYRPAPGRGAPEVIDSRAAKMKFSTGRSILTSSRPFISLEFRGADGKKKTYNFAALGTTCSPSDKLVPVSAGGVCGAASTACSSNSVPIFDPNAKALPLYVPETWQQDLTAVLVTIQQASQTASAGR